MFLLILNTLLQRVFGIGIIGSTRFLVVAATLRSIAATLLITASLLTILLTGTGLITALTGLVTTLLTVLRTGTGLVTAFARLITTLVIITGTRTIAALGSAAALQTSSKTFWSEAAVVLAMVSVVAALVVRTGRLVNTRTR